MRKLIFVTPVFFFLFSFIFAFGSATPANADTNVLFIVDASGSMKKNIDDKTRMDVAKDVLGKTLAEMPETANLGLLLYGHRRAKDCTDMELVAPIGAENATALGKTISALNPKGETPIADALTKAAKSFKVFKGQQNQIILVTDGKEECGGDPCVAAQALKDAGLDVAVNIVGFTLGAEDAKNLQCVTDITGGKYYSAADAAGLADALQDVQKEVAKTAIVQVAEAQGFNGDVLADENGAKLEIAPSIKWVNLNRDHESFATKHRPTYAGEAIWSFKDGKSATFDQIEMHIPSQNNYNVKDFEVLAADDLNGPYRSLGKFTTLNVNMKPAGWQGFKFPETTAYYVKISFKEAFNGYVGGNAIRVLGSINDDSEPKSTAKEDNGTDVLAQKNGATLIYAPNPKWSGINSLKPEEFISKGRPTYAGEGVWSFKGGKSATINKAKVMVDGTNNYNLRTFEILTSDTLEGPYNSLGEFTVQNVRVMPDGWQHFPLPETTAHFVKINFINAVADNYVGGNAIQLIGKINDDSEAVTSSAPPEGTDILAQENGGYLLFGPNDEWEKLNKGNERAVVRVGEAVWAFKDEKTANLKAVQIYIGQREQYNLKDFEILVGDEGPTGTFRSIGKFSTQNALVLPDGWQSFTLPEGTKAKYLKLKTIAAHTDNYIAMYGMKIIGELE